MVTLLCAICAKVNGHKNSQYMVKAMNFFILSGSIARNTFIFVSANLLGTGLREIKQTNANMRKELFIHIEKDSIKNRLFLCINYLTDNNLDEGNGVMTNLLSSA